MTNDKGMGGGVDGMGSRGRSDGGACAAIGPITMEVMIKGWGERMRGRRSVTGNSGGCLGNVSVSPGFRGSLRNAHCQRWRVSVDAAVNKAESNALGLLKQYKPCISINARDASVGVPNLTNPYPLLTPMTGSTMIFALLQLRNGATNLGSLSCLRPRMGSRKTAMRSEFVVSGARSPTKMENSC